MWPPPYSLFGPRDPHPPGPVSVKWGGVSGAPPCGMFGPGDPIYCDLFFFLMGGGLLVWEGGGRVGFGGVGLGWAGLFVCVLGSAVL